MAEIEPLIAQMKQMKTDLKSGSYFLIRVICVICGWRPRTGENKRVRNA